MCFFLCVCGYDGGVFVVQSTFGFAHFQHTKEKAGENKERNTYLRTPMIRQTDDNE